MVTNPHRVECIQPQYILRIVTAMSSHCCTIQQWFMIMTYILCQWRHWIVTKLISRYCVTSSLSCQGTDITAYRVRRRAKEEVRVTIHCQRGGLCIGTHKPLHDNYQINPIIWCIWGLRSSERDEITTNLKKYILSSQQFFRGVYKLVLPQITTSSLKWQVNRCEIMLVFCPLEPYNSKFHRKECWIGW